jgi:predicted glycoside hydrolase/deacetylase ChbG (UPF0249 family)
MGNGASWAGTKLTPAGALASRLGLTRAIVLHVDDLGSCEGANRAFLDLAAHGLVSSGSVMVPGPAFHSIADVAARSAALDLGIHLTLTSEWPTRRWAPLSTKSRSSGLVDDDGWMWPDVESLRRHLVLDAAEIELRTQIERALALGVRATHIDAHMGAAMMAELIDVEIRLALDYGLMPVLPRSVTWPLGLERYYAAISELDRLKLPVVDHMLATLAVSPEELPARWRAQLGALPDGITHIALHATQPGEIEAFAQRHAEWRIAEYELLARGSMRGFCNEMKLPVISYRPIQPLWRNEHVPVLPGAK